MVVPFREGDIIRHFKRDMVSDEAKAQNMYLYKVLAVGMHTETKERMLVYQALYYPFGVFIRPLDMAMEEISPDQYPYIPLFLILFVLILGFLHIYHNFF